MPSDPLPETCADLDCPWQPIPHVHEDGAVYPAPVDRVEWVAALASEEGTPHD